MMALVAASAVLSWMAVAAWRVRADPGCRYIAHFWERAEGPDGAPKPMQTACGAPFWPQYARRLLGLPWPGSYRCGCDGLGPGFGEFGLMGPRGLELHRYRLVGTRSVSREEEPGVRASLRSLKTIGLADPPDALHHPRP
jgi:hypothetical protein